MRRRKSVELFERKETTIWMNSCLEASVSMGSYRFKLRSNGLLWCSMDQTLNRKVRNIPYILKMLSDSVRTFFRFINQHLIPTLVLCQLRFNWFKKINVHEFPFSQPLEDVFERQSADMISNRVQFSKSIRRFLLVFFFPLKRLFFFHCGN
jgi:hypothetical protein